MVSLAVHARAPDAYASVLHLLCPTPDGAEAWMRRPMSIYRIDKAAGQIEFSTSARGARHARHGHVGAVGDEFNIAGLLGLVAPIRPGKTSSFWAGVWIRRRWRRCRSLRRGEERRRDRDPRRAQPRRGHVEGVAGRSRRQDGHRSTPIPERRRQRRAHPRDADRAEEGRRVLHLRLEPAVC